MKLGIVPPDQFEVHLEGCRSQPQSNGVSFVHSSIGRHKGDIEVPDAIRMLIADEHLTKGREAALELGAELGVSPSSVSAYSKGATSTATYNKGSETLHKYLTSRKQNISKKALKVLTNSLHQLTPEKLQGVKARDLAAIAKDMSTISNNMQDKQDTNGASAPQFIVYAPQVKDERSYETIIVNDNF